MDRTLRLSSEWVCEMLERDVKPLGRGLVGEFDLDEAQTERLIEVLRAVFLRGARDAFAELGAQIIAAREALGVPNPFPVKVGVSDEWDVNA